MSLGVLIYAGDFKLMRKIAECLFVFFIYTTTQYLIDTAQYSPHKVYAVETFLWVIVKPEIHHLAG